MKKKNYYPRVIQITSLYADANLATADLSTADLFIGDAVNNDTCEMSKSSFASEISLGRKELLPHVRSGIVSLVQSEKRKKREDGEGM